MCRHEWIVQTGCLPTLILSISKNRSVHESVRFTAYFLSAAWRATRLLLRCGLSGAYRSVSYTSYTYSLVTDAQPVLFRIYASSGQCKLQIRVSIILLILTSAVPELFVCLSLSLFASVSIFSRLAYASRLGPAICSHLQDYIAEKGGNAESCVEKADLVEGARGLSGQVHISIPVTLFVSVCTAFRV